MSSYNHAGDPKCDRSRKAHKSQEDRSLEGRGGGGSRSSEWDVAQLKTWAYSTWVLYRMESGQSLFELLMPDWHKLRAPSRQNLRNHLIEIDPLCEQRQLYIYIYIQVYMYIYTYICLYYVCIMAYSIEMFCEIPSRPRKIYNYLKVWKAQPLDNS